MIELFQRLVAWAMNRVRVNQIRPSTLDGVPMLIKCRRTGGSLIIWFANQFLALARSGIRMVVRVDEWVNWEVDCNRLLYPERPAKIGPERTVLVPKVHGFSLRQLLHRREADVSAFAAAARELRRVHQIQCEYFQGAWSHGDPHLDNIMYERTADRVTLIDFDTRHESWISSTQRHSDDLKVMLLELIASPGEEWCQLATALIEEYREAAVLRELHRQLFIPHGLARILWFTRTDCVSIRQIEPRVHRLREIIGRVVAPGDSSQIRLCRGAS